MMLSELSLLLDYVPDHQAPLEAYRDAVIQDNCLNKRSQNNRQLTFTYLTELYSLNTKHALFRALRFFWERDESGRPLLALLAAYARDGILRASTEFVMNVELEENLSRDAFAAYLDAMNPGRYSETTLQSIVRNLSSTWTQSGHLSGRSDKVRVQAAATPGATAFALLLSYLEGQRGMTLFASRYAELLDDSGPRIMQLAEKASGSGWIQMNHVGTVVEVLFPRLLNAQEMEWLREQA